MIPALAGATPPASQNQANAMAPLVHEAEILASVQEVWNVFSTAEGFRKLGPALAEMDFRPGGTIRSHYHAQGVLGDDGTIEQTILAFEPERMVAFRISKPPREFPFPNAWKNVWSVATMEGLAGGSTRLRLAMMGYAADEESQRMRAFFDQGNAWVLEHLKKSFQPTGQVSPRPSPVSEGPPAVGSDDPLAPITVVTRIHAPASEVWNCWASSEGIKSFLSEGANVQLAVGGPFEIYFDMSAPEGSRGSEGCRVLAYDPSRMLSFSWNAPPKFPYARDKHTWVVLHVEPAGAHSARVELRHLGFAENNAAEPGHTEEWVGVRTYFQAAWPQVIAALERHLTTPAAP